MHSDVSTPPMYVLSHTCSFSGNATYVGYNYCTCTVCAHVLLKLPGQCLEIYYMINYSTMITVTPWEVQLLHSDHACITVMHHGRQVGSFCFCHCLLEYSSSSSFRSLICRWFFTLWLTAQLTRPGFYYLTVVDRTIGKCYVGSGTILISSEATPLSCRSC